MQILLPDSSTPWARQQISIQLFDVFAPERPLLTLMNYTVSFCFLTAHRIPVICHDTETLLSTFGFTFHRCRSSQLGDADVSLRQRSRMSQGLMDWLEEFYYQASCLTCRPQMFTDVIWLRSLLSGEDILISLPLSALLSLLSHIDITDATGRKCFIDLCLLKCDELVGCGEEFHSVLASAGSKLRHWSNGDALCLHFFSSLLYMYPPLDLFNLLVRLGAVVQFVITDSLSPLELAAGTHQLEYVSRHITEVQDIAYVRAAARSGDVEMLRLLSSSTNDYIILLVEYAEDPDMPDILSLALTRKQLPTASYLLEQANAEFYTVGHCDLLSLWSHVWNKASVDLLISTCSVEEALLYYLGEDADVVTYLLQMGALLNAFFGYSPYDDDRRHYYSLMQMENPAAVVRRFRSYDVRIPSVQIFPPEDWDVELYASVLLTACNEGDGPLVRFLVSTTLDIGILTRALSVASSNGNVAISNMLMQSLLALTDRASYI